MTGQGFWDDAEVISAYTRAQAIEDGVLVPTTDLVPDEPDFARQAGWIIPVALTGAASHLVIPTQREADGAGQDVKGRLWDVLHMARLHGSRSAGSEVVFPCIFWLADRDGVRRAGPRTLHLKAVVGGNDDGSPCLTIMLPEED